MKLECIKKKDVQHMEIFLYSIYKLKLIKNRQVMRLSAPASSVPMMNCGISPSPSNAHVSSDWLKSLLPNFSHLRLAPPGVSQSASCFTVRFVIKASSFKSDGKC